MTAPWAKGDYVESITRGATEVGTIGLGWINSSNAAKAKKAAEAAKTGRASAAAGAKAASVADAARPAQTLSSYFDGVHIARAKSRVSTKPNTAFFWSGRSEDLAGNKVGGAERAAEIARDNKGITLETLIEERKIEMSNWDPNNPVAVKQ
ncbi:hypothetical protein [Massilia soli]|uniref:Uncharacterized protein n=1 Tax=Massilia soli TaxID=2792854 RepID=A0ABS7SVF0_9BURK|nr:hypothetical protein [Massilia soli]MBZ2209931.1 hypothetical protein [Massilia soli]